MAGAANYTGAVVVALIGIVLSSVSLLPVAVDRLEFNSASLSRELQMWRSQGQYYVHNRSTPVVCTYDRPQSQTSGQTARSCTCQAG